MTTSSPPPSEPVDWAARNLELYRRVQAGDEAARWELVTSVASFCTNLVFRTPSAPQEIADFNSFLMEYLYRATVKWDPERGMWSTYAALWTKAARNHWARSRDTVRPQPVNAGTKRTFNRAIMIHPEAPGGATFDEVLGRQEAEAGDVASELRRIVAAAKLSERELSYLTRHSLAEETLESIGETEGCTRERVRQVHQRAMSKLSRVARIDQRRAG